VRAGVGLQLGHGQQHTPADRRIDTA
jgi:hypothetical protein